MIIFVLEEERKNPFKQLTTLSEDLKAEKQRKEEERINKNKELLELLKLSRDLVFNKIQDANIGGIEVELSDVSHPSYTLPYAYIKLKKAGVGNYSHIHIYENIKTTIELINDELIINIICDYTKKLHTDRVKVKTQEDYERLIFDIVKWFITKEN